LFAFRLLQAGRIRTESLGLVRPFARHHRLIAEWYAGARQVLARLIFCAAANAADARLMRLALRAGLGVLFLQNDKV